MHRRNAGATWCATSTRGSASSMSSRAPGSTWRRARARASGDPRCVKTFICDAVREQGGCMLPTHDRARWLARHILPHEPELRSWLRGKAVAGFEVDDVVQETYAQLAGLASVDHIETPRAYAFQTARSLILRHIRRGRIAPMEAIDDTLFDVTANGDPSPEQQVTARQELRCVAEIIDGLPIRCREAFLLRRIDGLSQRHVAVRMGIAESTVEKHVS